jgi:signal transduction histidine kinase
MRARLTAAFVSIIFVMLLVQDIPLVNYLNTVEHNQITTSLERDAWRLAELTDTRMRNQEYETITRDIEKYVANTGSRVVYVNNSGIVVVSSDGSDIGADYTNRPEIADALKGRATSGERESIAIADSLLYIAVPIESNGALTGAIRITFPGAVIDAEISDRIRGILLVALLTLVVTIVVTWLIANAITFRLRRLHKATTDLAAGDLTVRVGEFKATGGSPEIRQLEAAFDNMVERLSKVLESQRSFASDASHQLRTPLTALRLKLENAAATLDNINATEAALESASNEVVRLQLLVDGLLALARLEGSTPHLFPINISELINKRIEMWIPLAEEKEIQFVVEIENDLWAMGTESSIDQIIDAYLDNALDFAPEGSAIVVRATELDGDIHIRIVDSGPGLSREQISRAFDRFWRGRTDETGTGLGLAIVARLANVIGAEAKLSQVFADGHGLQAELNLPRISRP